MNNKNKKLKIENNNNKEQQKNEDDQINLILSKLLQNKSIINKKLEEDLNKHIIIYNNNI